MELAGRTRATARPSRRAALGAALLTAAIALAVAAYLAKPEPSLRPWPVLLLWLGSIAALLGGAWALEPRRARSRALGSLPRGELAFVAVLTLGGLLMRTVALERIPDTFAGDEAESADYARSVLAGRVQDPFSTGWAGHPTLWFFLQGLSLRLFGDGVVGARMLSAALGAAAVPAVYLFARRGFGRTVAALAAVLLAGWHFHLHYSRIGVNSVGDPLLVLVALGALVAGLRRRSPLMLAVAGVSAGVAQHFYLGSRLLPVVAAAVVAHQLLFNRGAVRGAVRYLPLAALGLAVGYGPGVRVPLYHWNDYNARLAEVGVFQSGWFDERRELGDSVLEIVWLQVSSSLGAFTHVADHSVNYWHGMPLLDSVSAAFFVLGVVLALRRWRRCENAVLLIWLAGAVTAGGILVVDSPQSHRYVTVAPAVCVLVALGIVRAAVGVAWAVRRPSIARGVAAAIAAGLVLWSVDFYFREYSPRHLYGARLGEEITAIGRYLDARPGRPFVYFFGPPRVFFDVGTIRFLAPDVPGTDVDPPLRRPRDLRPEPAARAPLFVFLPERLPELAVVRRRYPDGALRTFVSKADGLPLFAAYEPALDAR